jgi:uroporphyrin-III C-methyltransferase/precorrin-2 dehydrogenase/sirohydrochlorin ferrochelatase
LCDFTTPSVLDRDPVLLAIGTDGASAGLAKHVRLRLEALLPAGLGRLAEALAAARAAIRAGGPVAEERRLVLDGALGAGGALDPPAGAGPREVAAWLTAATEAAPASRVELAVAADPGDLTLRQLQLLGAADTILFDPAVPSVVLDRARSDAVRRPLGVDDGAARPGLTVVLRPA